GPDPVPRRGGGNVAQHDEGDCEPDAADDVQDLHDQPFAEPNGDLSLRRCSRCLRTLSTSARSRCRPCAAGSPVKTTKGTGATPRRDTRALDGGCCSQLPAWSAGGRQPVHVPAVCAAAAQT